MMTGKEMSVALAQEVLGRRTATGG